MYPDLFKIGPLTIHSFGVMAMLGFLIPTLIMRREFSRIKIDADFANSIAVGAIIGGFVGARLYFIIEHWSEFLREPWGMIFSGAGLVWYGGFIGGTLGVLWIIHRHKQPLLRVLDTVGPLLLLGYAIGRIGCHLAGDGDYGPPTTVPWAVSYAKGVVPTQPGELVHPTPIYDFILSTIFFGILWLYRRRVTLPGSMLCYAMIAMGVERFITEFWRNTPKLAFGWMSLAQMISIAVIVLSVVLLSTFINMNTTNLLDHVGTATRTEANRKQEQQKKDDD